MTDLAQLFAGVRARAEQQSTDLPPPVGEQDLAQAESSLGFTLPPVLSGLYRQVANGGFGPEYLLLPLTGPGRTAVAEYGPLRSTTSEDCPRGVLPILDWGCGMYAAIDCLHPEAPVLLFVPNAEPDDWADAWFLDWPSLAQWLTSWLSLPSRSAPGRCSPPRADRTRRELGSSCLAPVSAGAAVRRCR